MVNDYKKLQTRQIRPAGLSVRNSSALKVMALNLPLSVSYQFSIDFIQYCSFSAVPDVQKTAPLNFCTPPDQDQFNGESVSHRCIVRKRAGVFRFIQNNIPEGKKQYFLFCLKQTGYFPHTQTEKIYFILIYA